MKKLKYALSILFMLAIASCSKEDQAPTPPAPTDVYVAGWSRSNQPGQERRATIWKNGVATLLTDGTQEASAYSVCVSNGDVYAVGTETNNTTSSVMKYWKNGVLQNLNLTSTNASQGKALTVANNNVYVLGKDGSIVKYWKNGVSHDITLGTTNASPSDIKVVNNDIYIAYTEGNYAKLWKNGVVTNLSDGTAPELVSALTIDNNNVYVLSGRNDQVKYWKNGIETLVVNTSGGNSVGYCMDVSGGDLYIGGFQKGKPQLWKNGIAQYDTTTTVADGYLSALKIFNNNFYATGRRLGITNLWLNADISVLSPSTYDSDSWAIYVTN